MDKREGADHRWRRWMMALYGLSLPALLVAAALIKWGGGAAHRTLPDDPLVQGARALGQASGQMVVLGYNDLGMHCLNQDYSELVILPPFNTLHAQVIDRSGEDPRIVTSGITVNYRLPNNTHSADKINFWQYAQALFGVVLPPNVGLQATVSPARCVRPARATGPRPAFRSRLWKTTAK